MQQQQHACRSCMHFEINFETTSSQKTSCRTWFLVIFQVFHDFRSLWEPCHRVVFFFFFFSLNTIFFLYVIMYLKPFVTLMLNISFFPLHKLHWTVVNVFMLYDLLAVVGVVYCSFVTFPCGNLDQVWYLIVSFPDLCLLSFLTFIGRLLDRKPKKK